jgi:hypothetical protein
MNQGTDAAGAERSAEEAEIDRLPSRAVAEAREARTAVLRSFLRLRQQGVKWAADPEPQPDHASRDQR